MNETRRYTCEACGKIQDWTPGPGQDHLWPEGWWLMPTESTPERRAYACGRECRTALNARRGLVTR